MTLRPTTSRGISLRAALAQEMRGASIPDVRATSCASNWRQVQPGDVFVALQTANDDGHDGAVEAVRRGAVAVICERPLPVFGIPQVVVPDSRFAFGRLCQALVGDPSRQLKVIGVTGTHGKTIFARLLTAIFHAAGKSAGTLDSYGYWDGSDDLPASPLTPPLLAQSLARMNAAGAMHAVVELSSRELSEQVLAGVTLDAACVTNVARHHINWHNSLANYRAAKSRILRFLHEDAVAILNADDPVCVEMLSTLDRPALTFGMRLPAEITATVIEQHVNEQTFVLSAGDDSIGVRTAIVGDYHVYNCLAAAAMALAYGVDLRQIARGLEVVDRLPGRMERVVCGQGFAVLVDAADSPEALRQALRSARTVTSGRVICVFGAHDECDPAALPAMGRVLGAMADLTVLTTAGALSDGSHRACLEVRSGFADPRRARVAVDRQAAIAWALNEAAPGDTVLIAGLGERPHSPLDNSGQLATDHEIAQHLLRELEPASNRYLAA